MIIYVFACLFSYCKHKSYFHISGIWCTFTRCEITIFTIIFVSLHCTLGPPAPPDAGSAACFQEASGIRRGARVFEPKGQHVVT